MKNAPLLDTRFSRFLYFTTLHLKSIYIYNAYHISPYINAMYIIHICRTTQKNVQASQCKLNKDRLFVLYVELRIMIGD